MEGLLDDISNGLNSHYCYMYSKAEECLALASWHMRIMSSIVVSEIFRLRSKFNTRFRLAKDTSCLESTSNKVNSDFSWSVKVSLHYWNEWVFCPYYFIGTKFQKFLIGELALVAWRLIAVNIEFFLLSYQLVQHQVIFLVHLIAKNLQGLDCIFPSDLTRASQIV